MKQKIKYIALFTLLLSYGSVNAQSVVVRVKAGDNQALIDAIISANKNSNQTIILLEPGVNGDTSFDFTMPFEGSDNALPVITSDIKISGGNSNQTYNFIGVQSSNFRLFGVEGTGKLRIEDQITIESFGFNGNGGAISVSDNAFLKIDNIKFFNNFATGNGGAISLSGSAGIRSFRCTFDENRSSNLGGALSITSTGTNNIYQSIFENNNAVVFGCDINYSSSSNDGSLEIFYNTFVADCKNVLIENPNGKLRISSNTFAGKGDLLDTTSAVSLISNVIDVEPDTKQSLDKACNTFGIGVITSLGYNVDSSNSCNLTHETDLLNTDPLLNLPDINGIITLQSSSPAIDTGANTYLENNNGFDFLPCGYKDSRGLGRPQDANGDGVFECDRGSYEVQGGVDLSHAQSGLYFDMDRSGEGIIVEMLGSGSALVTMFTYHPNKTDLMWFIGVGDVVGNSIVIDTLQRTSGGVFGSAFNADDIVRTDIGGMSIVFPNCESQSNPGRLTFEAGFEFANELENMLVKNSRLSRLLNCNQSQPNAQSGRSGAFFDPARSGEGIFVQVLDNGNAVVIFYTYTPDGKQFWSISSDVQIDGNTLTANMLYPASTTGFGSQFNPDEVNLQPWGTLILEYQAGCSNINVNYNSVVNGYGSGTLSYQRLTQPAGTTCDL